MFKPAVECLGGAVGCAWEIEVGQDVGGTACQGATQATQLGQGGGNPAPYGLDHALKLSLAAVSVGVTVGSNYALIDPPGDLDRNMLVARKHRIDAGALVVGEERPTGVESATDPLERVPGASAMPEGGLLDPLTAAV